MSRHDQRRAEQQQADAELCRLPLTDYLALSRRERKRRLQAARKTDQVTVSPCAGCGLKSWDADDLEPGDFVCTCAGPVTA